MAQIWQLAHGRKLELGENAHIMGILNITPDSFSDGGFNNSMDNALASTERMLAEGASILDIGGESTRPGATPVEQSEEQARVVPIITEVAKRFDCVISVDTYRAKTARAAVEAGAHIVNDVWGLQREPEIADIAKETGAGLVIMYTSRERQTDPDIITDRIEFLRKSLKIAADSGVRDDQIVLDPGFGFGNSSSEDIPLMARMGELRTLKFPLLIGTSRKRFIEKITGQADVLKRDVGTSATSVALRLAGGDIFRVHNVAFNRDGLAVADAILHAQATIVKE